MSDKEKTLFSLDVVVCFNKLLLDKEILDKFGQLLLRYAPKWVERLHVWPRKKGLTVNVSIPGSLFESIRSDIVKESDTYRKLVEYFGYPKKRCVCGYTELHGSDKSLTLVFSVDERIFHCIGEIWLWGNEITLQINKPKIDNMDAIIWAKKMFIELCNEFPVWYGTVKMQEEYDSKNMLYSEDRVEAIGVDISKCLPGLYWLNFFGIPYVELIGKERLLKSPAYEICEMDSGILVEVDESPSKWNSLEYKAKEHAILDHIGRKYFFLREDPQYPTIAPNFALTKI